MEEEKLPYKNKNNGLGLIFTFVFLSFCLFTAGYNVRGWLDSGSESNNGNNKDTKEETSKSTISYTDQVVFSTYGGENLIYVIDDDGELNYGTTNEYIAGLNLCPSAVDYCNGNPKYSNKLDSVSGVSDVKKIKYVIDIAASDERFKLFAIDKNGDVYLVEKTNAKKIIEGQKITDMIGLSVTNHYYSFKTVDKEKRIDYTWVMDTSGGHYDIKTITS